MKTTLLLIAIFLFDLATGQEKKTYPVKVGEIPNQVLPRQAMYLLPEFRNGTVLTRDGLSSSLQMNYDFLQDEMHFITGKGDTLAIADAATIRAITIDSFTFYYDHGFLRQLSGVGGFRLAVKQQMVQMADKTRGAYDAPFATSAIQTYGSLVKGSQQYSLRVQKDVFFEEIDSYYIGQKFNTYLKANKKNFRLLFPDKEVSKFTNDHHTDFKNPGDILDLLKFCVL